MYAVIITGGKQYRVSEGDVIYIEKLDVSAEEKVVFDKVLSVSKDDSLTIGTPLLEGAKVNGTIIKNGKSKKITVFTYRAKKGSKRKMGHRQQYTKVQIDTIEA
jgi:large subunit ribosomal protein L21